MTSKTNTFKTDIASENLDHFDLNNDAAYSAWRNKKLSMYLVKKTKFGCENRKFC